MKTGFSYYNIDTDRYQDIRIKRLKKDCGCVGIAVYDYILCEIYRVRGCVLEWDENTAFDVAEYFGLKESQIVEIVNYCCAVGLFNKELLTNGSVLTSDSIQRRYTEMCKRSKRTNCEIPEKWKIPPEEHTKTPEETVKLQEEIDREKKSKEKERERKTEIPPPDSISILMETIDECSSLLKSRGDPFFFLVRNAVMGKREIHSTKELHDYIDQFATELKAKGEELKNPRDFQNHFINWIKKPSNGSATDKKTGGIYKA